MSEDSGFYGKFLTETQYLKIEETAREKNEYVAGRLYAMSGVTFAHNTVANNLQRLLYHPAKVNGCRVYSSDVKVRITDANCYYYPDVSISCEGFTPSAIYLTSPRLLVEVLSPSTESIDRREKMVAYRSLTSLTEYAIAHQDQPLIEVYKKDPSGGWVLTEFRNMESVRFESFPSGPVEIPLSEIYDWLGTADLETDAG